MSATKRPDGKWRARYRDPAGKEHAKHFDTEREAKDWLAENRVAMRSGKWTDPKDSKVTLEQFYREWAQRQVWESGTRLAMDLAMRGCTFAGYPLSQVKVSHAEAWVKSMSAAGLAPGTIRTRVNNVRSVLRAAVRDRHIPENPLDRVKLPRLRRAEAAMTIPEPETVGKIIDASEPWFAPFVALCAFSGLRLGEAAALQVGDIDFLRRQLKVERQVQRGAGGAIEIRPPKYGSERVVFLPDDMVELLSRHVTETGVTREGWLFGTGQPPHQNTVGHWWRRTIKRAGVDPVRLHDLRHFYASGLIAAGCDVVTVQRALGHSSATTTLNTYAHLWPSAEDRTRTAAADVMRSTRGIADQMRTDRTKKAQ